MRLGPCGHRKALFNGLYARSSCRAVHSVVRLKSMAGGCACTRREREASPWQSRPPDSGDPTSECVKHTEHVRARTCAGFVFTETTLFSGSHSPDSLPYPQSKRPIDAESVDMFLLNSQQARE